MTYGDGSISELGRNHYRIRVYMGNDPITKRPLYASKTIHGPKSEARKIRDQLIKDRDNGLSFENKDITFVDFATQWYKARIESGNFAERTLEEDERITRILSEYIGPIRVKDISPETIESLLFQLRKERGRNDKPLSGTTLNKYYIILKQILAKAVDRDIILRNPCDRVKAPKKEKPAREPLSQEDIIKFMRFVDEQEANAYSDFQEKEARRTQSKKDKPRSAVRGIHKISNIIAARIGANTGMRIGEVLGLIWGNVDLNKRKIHVVQAITNNGNIKETKNGRKRIISIDAITASHLSKWKAFQEAFLKEITIEQSDTTPVCCTDTGTWYSIKNYERWWDEFRKKAGFPSLVFHELRHTQATQLIANGVDYKTVQERLGHASASTTMDLYAHALPEKDEEAATLVGNIFNAPNIKTLGMSRKTA